ncbi:MAG: hypothetical protein KKG33_04405 [candidate division Zixibacteria bacterium]|nr:hypothetical protein [candidate division Zixibacteria bacterium]
MRDYYYDFRDIFKAPRIALHGKNIYLQMKNLLVGYIGYSIIAYVALLVDGVDLGFAWDVHSFFPVGTLGLVSLPGKLIWIAGLLWFAVCLLRGNLAVSRTAYEEIRGNLFYSVTEAKSFIKQKKGVLYKSYLGVIGFIVFMIILGLIAGLIGKIPYAGEISYGLFYAFPYFILSLFTVLILFLFTTFALTGPAVLGVKGEDTLTALFDGFSMVTSRPLRWSILTGASLVIAKVCSFVLFYFSYRAFQFTNATTSVFMGDKGKLIFESAFDKLPVSSPVIKFLSYLYPGSDFGINLYLLGAFNQATTTFAIASYLIVIGVSLVFAFIIAYFINTIVVGQVIAFVNIRRQTHDECLAELPEDELWDDFSIEEKTEDTAGEEAKTVG